MSKTTIVSIVGVVVVIGALVGYFAFAPKGADEGTGKSGSEDGSSQDMKSLLASGRPQRCTFSQTVEGTESTGVVYVAGGKMRGDFESKTATAGTMQSHMIVMSDMSYFWTDGMGMGFKSSLAEDKTPDRTTSPSIDLDQELDYDCDSWATDQGMFALPSDITFQDMRAMGAPGSVPPGSGMMPGSGAGSGQDMKALQCSSCDSAPEPSRSQCRAALGC